MHRRGGYYLVVLREGGTIPRPVKLVNYSTAQDMRLGYYVAAHLTPEQLNEALDFVVGDGDVIGGFKNPPLTDAMPYRFGLLAETNFSGEVLYGYSLTAPVIVNGGGSAAGVGVVIGAILVLLILIIAAIALTFYYVRDTSFRFLCNPVDENSMSESRMTLNMESSDSVNMTVVANGGLPSKPVPLKRLQDHVIQGQANGVLKEEYMTTPKGQLHPWNEAKKAENKPKNRYGNILPCPKQSTLTDFWRMVWQEGSCKIIMLTNLKEQDKTKCEQYWPETSQKYGKFMVTLMKADTQVDFVVREFEIALGAALQRPAATAHARHSVPRRSPMPPTTAGTAKAALPLVPTATTKAAASSCSGQGIPAPKEVPSTSSPRGPKVSPPEVKETPGSADMKASSHQARSQAQNISSQMRTRSASEEAKDTTAPLENKTRTVVQFHFTTWPDHGVPLYPDALLPFLRRIWDFQPHDDHPVIVHCSGGIGRTGTLVLVDSMLSQAEAEGEVNLVAHLHTMRQSRVNLVESLEQYIFAYMALVEILCSKNHKLSVKEFVTLYQKLKAKSAATGKSAIDLEYEGFKRRKAYLVTQLPLPETIDDFWEMFATSGSVTLVTLGPLQDETTPQFWPSLKTTVKYGKAVVEQTDSQDFRGLLVRTFKVVYGSVSRILKQFHSQSWNRASTVPSSCDLVLEILQHVDRWQMQAEGRAVVVQCLDGCQESGLYCVCAAICDQLKLEQELDVFRSVRNVRCSRPEFIVDSEQYSFCYDLALSFLDTFDTYSNFQ
ncbi:hypothetical protein HPB51_005767 [Rhipicephalus microplus]|uniref:protein-tyrosine-phosphatase n=1 Tax=Rhipicephalus microplus TaxID=6941 RepID=A0A9J6EN21_RHIMP|nr:hypothetical protein HPB51_005767 [Rhipicephalus microplus]